MADNDGAGRGLVERARAMLAEAQAEVAELERQRDALTEERDEEIKQVRERYAERARRINGELAMVRRLERALDPDIAARTVLGKAPAKKSSASPKERGWTPSEEQRRKIIRAMRVEGGETVSTIAEIASVSQTTVKYGLDALREDGTVRLKGTGPNNTRLYALTPKGENVATEIVNGQEDDSPLYDAARSSRRT